MAAVPALAALVLVTGCASPTPPAPPEIPAPIEIQAPAQRLEWSVSLRQGSFARTNASPRGVVARFRKLIESAEVFAVVEDPSNESPGGAATAASQAAAPVDLVLTAEDYGEPNAYTFELKALLVREREPLGNYVSKQSVRQSGRGQLTIGPEQLGKLAENAIRDVIRQIAADTERLAGL